MKGKSDQFNNVMWWEPSVKGHVWLDAFLLNVRESVTQYKIIVENNLFSMLILLASIIDMRPCLGLHLIVV